MINCFAILLFISCKDLNTEKSILSGKACTCYNEIKITKFPRSLGKTYCFKKNRELYILSYDMNIKAGKRLGTFEDFNTPKKWSVQGDSLILDNLAFKIVKKNNFEYVLNSKYDKVILRRETDTFSIKFLKNDNKFYIRNKEEDTIKIIDLIEM